MSANSDWFKNINESPLTNPKLVNGLVVEKVAPESPGEDIGLQAGDYLLSVNGKSAHAVDLTDVLINETSVEYVFYRAQSQSQVAFSTDALPLGVRLSPSSENIALSYRSIPLHQGSGLRTLWERGEYQIIRDICSDGFLGKLKVRKRLNPLRDVMLAICDLEAGKKTKKVYAALDSFKPYADRYTSDYTSLVDYYLALKARDEGNAHLFKDRMWHVMQHNQECARIKADADAGRVSYVPDGERLGHKYEPGFSMPYLEGGEGNGSLAAIRKTMKPGQILPICFMLTYRGNGPYNDGLKQYRAMYPHCKDKLLPMLVITSVRDKRADRPDWFEAEEALIKAGMPITILFDESGLFADSNLSGAPEYICVDNKSTVIWDDGLYDDCAYWTMLSGPAKKKPMNQGKLPLP